MINNLDRSGSVSTTPEKSTRQTPTDVRSGSVQTNVNESATVITIPRVVRIGVRDGRLELIKISK
jgi:hypothetical protein